MVKKLDPRVSMTILDKSWEVRALDKDGKDGDSIRSVAKKIRESYGWTFKWTLELEKLGARQREKQELSIHKDNYFYKEIII